MFHLLQVVRTNQFQIHVSLLFESANKHTCKFNLLTNTYVYGIHK